MKSSPTLTGLIEQRIFDALTLAVLFQQTLTFPSPKIAPPAPALSKVDIDDGPVRVAVWVRHSQLPVAKAENLTTFHCKLGAAVVAELSLRR